MTEIEGDIGRVLLCCVSGGLASLMYFFEKLAFAVGSSGYPPYSRPFRANLQDKLTLGFLHLTAKSRSGDLHIVL